MDAFLYSQSFRQGLHLEDSSRGEHDDDDLSDIEQARQSLSSALSGGSDFDLQAAVGHGTSVWRNAAIFGPTPSSHSRPSTSCTDKGDDQTTRNLPLQEYRCSVDDREDDNNESLSSTPTTISFHSSGPDSGAGIFARGPIPRSGEMMSIDSRRQGTSSAGERRLVSSGIFIVSKSGPSWISDRPSPSASTFTLPSQGRGGSPLPPQGNRANTILSIDMASSYEDSAAAPHIEQRPSQATLHASREGSQNSIVNWLEAQDVNKGSQRSYSSIGSSTILHKSASSTTARRQNSDPQPAQGQVAETSSLPINTFRGERQRRVSGPRPLGAPRRSEHQRQDSRQSIPRPSSELEFVTELDRALLSHLNATAASRSKQSVDDSEEDVPGEELAEEELINQYAEDDEAGTEHEAGEEEGGDDDSDGCSMIAKMGSMSSAGVLQRSPCSDSEREAMMEDAISERRGGGVDSDDEERFWVGSSRNSAIGTPLPSVAGHSDTQSTSRWDVSSVRSAPLGPTEGKVRGVPSRNLVLPQVADAASRSSGRYRHKWRRSHPTLGRVPSSRPALVEMERTASRAGSAFSYVTRDGGNQSETPLPFGAGNILTKESDSEGGRETVRSSSPSEGTSGGRMDSDLDMPDDEQGYDGLTVPVVKVHTAQKAALSRTDAVVLMPNTPSPLRPSFLVPRSPVKKYIEASIQTSTSSFENKLSSVRYSCEISHPGLDQPNGSARKKNKRPDLRIDTGAGLQSSRDQRLAAGPMKTSASRSTFGVCCPKCGHDFIPPPKNLDTAAAVDGAKKLAEARVQARAAALAASANLSLRSAPAQTAAFSSEAKVAEAREVPPPLPSNAPALVLAAAAARRQISESEAEQLVDSRNVYGGRRSTMASSIDNDNYSRRTNHASSNSHGTRRGSQSSTHTTASRWSDPRERNGVPIPAVIGYPEIQPNKKRPQPHHSKRPSLSDVLNTFREFASPLDKIAGQHFSSADQGTPTGPLHLSRSGSSRSSSSPHKGADSESRRSRFNSPVPSHRQGATGLLVRPQSETGGTPTSLATRRSDQSSTSVLKQQRKATSSTYDTDAPFLFFRDGTIDSSSADPMEMTTDPGPSENSDDDIDPDLTKVAPFTGQSIKAFKLLGLDEDIRTPGNSAFHQSREGQGGRKDRQHSRDSSSVDVTKRPPRSREGVASGGIESVQKKASLLPMTNSLAAATAASALRVSKSHMDMTNLSTPNLSSISASPMTPGPFRRELQSSAAVFSAGPVENGTTQGNPMKKLRQVWRKGKGKDSGGADFKESLETLPPSDLSPQGLSNTDLKSRGERGRVGRGGMRNARSPTPEELAMPSNVKSNTRRDRVGSGGHSTSISPTTARKDPLSTPTNNPEPPGRWALPSLDLASPPLFGNEGQQLREDGNPSLEGEDEKCVSWFAAAYG